ncbi:MAG: hypothetical protein O7J95_21895, partial [Planctomycetota bacterium]|nr:hypothetical protein [Planctomycetota bacterium]
AAEAAHRALAFDPAARLYRKALEVLAPTGAERRDLLRRLADALADGGRGAEAGPVYLEAAEGAERAESLELRSIAAHQFLMSGHLDEWQTVIEPIQRELGIRLTRSRFLALLRISRDLTWIRLRGFRYRKRDPATIQRDAILRLEVCFSLATGLSHINVLEGIQYHTLSVRLALRLGHPLYVALVVSRHIAYEVVGSGASDRRIKWLLKTATRLAEDVGVPVADADLNLGIGVGSFIKGEWGPAREPLRKAAKRIREECVGVWWEGDTAEFYGLMCLDFQGKFRELVPAGNLLLREAEDRGSLYMETDLRTRIIYLSDLLRDAPGDAQEGLDRAIAKWRSEEWSLQHYRWTESRISVALYRGEFAGAQELVAQVWPGFRRSFFHRVPLLWNVLVFGRERLALVEAGDSPKSGRARALLSKADRVGRRLARREPYAAGWGLLLRAGAANLSGNAEAALRHLEAAEEKFVKAEMGAYVAVTKRRRGELIGGDEGRELITEGNAWLEGQGIQNPAAWSRMYAPGFED